MKTKNSRFGQIFQYSLIKYIALGFGFIKGIINAKFLGPELLGIMGNLTLILGYCSYANLGILTSMNREYILYKDNNEEKAKKVLETAFTSLFILAFLFFLLGIGTLLIFKNNYGAYIAIIFIIAIFEQFRSYYVNYFRLKDEYTMINLIEVIYSIIIFILTLFLINSFKIYGVLISMLICEIIIFMVGMKKSKYIKLNIDFKILKTLITIGIPLLIYNLGFYILTTIDRWIIIKFYTESDLGYYTFANSMVSATLVFVSSILFLLYPKVIKAFNEEQSTNIMEKVKIYTRILEISSVIFFTIGLIVFRPFILIFLEQYKDSIGIYMLLLMAIIVNNLAYFSNCYIVSNNRQIYLVYLQILSIIINLSCNIIFFKIGFGVEGVALGTLLANFIYSLIQHIIFIKLTTKKIQILTAVGGYKRVLIYLVFVILIVVFNVKYIYYAILSIVLTALFYFKEIFKIREYIKIIRG